MSAWSLASLSKAWSTAEDDEQSQARDALSAAVSGEDVSVTNDGSTGHEMVDRTLSMVDGSFSRHGSANYICAPYKKEMFKNNWYEHGPGSERRMAIIAALQDLGVKVFIIDSVSTPTTADILHHIRRVVGFIARENRVLPKSGPLGYQRCLLYQDHQGRLFNLMLSQHSIGPFAKWQEYLDSFSGLEAMIALTVLARSFPCAVSFGQIDSFKPAYLSLILGLVLTEEISLSWLNASMMVRSAPSVSAHSLMSPVAPDLLRKTVVFILAIAGAATGYIQQIMTLVGIGLACLILLANLGARAWHFMRWKPQRYDGAGAALLAYLGAVCTGIVLPYMGHRNIEVGGKAAMEYVIRTSFLVAVAFVVSDIDAVQQFIVIGSEGCNQDMVNFVIGVWWTLTLLCSLCLCRRIPYYDSKPKDAERLLVIDHCSPAGYRVPSLPDYEIDPALARLGTNCASISVEFGFGIVMAFGVGAAIIYLAFTDWDDAVASQLQGVFAD